jgi:hypothetical protein
MGAPLRVRPASVGAVNGGGGGGGSAPSGAWSPTRGSLADGGASGAKARFGDLGGRDAMAAYRRSYSNPTMADWSQGSSTPMETIRQLSTPGA